MHAGAKGLGFGFLKELDCKWFFATFRASFAFPTPSAKLTTSSSPRPWAASTYFPKPSPTRSQLVRLRRFAGVSLSDAKVGDRIRNPESSEGS